MLYIGVRRRLPESLQNFRRVGSTPTAPAIILLKEVAIFKKGDDTMMLKNAFIKKYYWDTLITAEVNLLSQGQPPIQKDKKRLDIN